MDGLGAVEASEEYATRLHQLKMKKCEVDECMKMEISLLKENFTKQLDIMMSDIDQFDDARSSSENEYIESVESSTNSLVSATERYRRLAGVFME